MKNKFVSFFTQRRKELGYSQSKIANELGISDQAISNWERGITFPDLSYLSDIAKALNTNVLSLITGKHQNINIKENVNFDIARFSQYLLKLRKNKKLTQSDLGKILGVSGQNISKFENGGFLPSIELLEKYAKYFNVSFLNIYYGLDDDELYEEIPDEIKPNKLKWLIVSGISIIIIALLIIIPIVLIEKHTVTVVLDDQNILVHKIKSNEKIELPTLPTKKGYDTSWDNTDTLITEDKTFTVIYTPKKYTITYIFEDREFDNYVQEVTYDEEFVLYKPLNTTICEYTYQGNKIESGIYNYDHNIEILCKTTTLYQVTIILDKDNIKIQNVQKNEKIELPQLPTKKGYDTSWDNTDTLITEDKTFTVIYTPKKYTITYTFENNIVKEFTQEVTYGEKYVLKVPQVTNYSFVGYTYNGQVINNGIYEYDYNITIYGKFSNETYTVYYEFTNCRVINEAGYGCLFTIEEYELTRFISNCPFSPNEYDNYKIVAWKDRDGNIYEVGKSYTYNYKRDVNLCPIFEYSGNAFEVVIENGEAKITKYNIPKITMLVIPDYIVIGDKTYKVTSIAEKTFQDIYFINLALSSNITKISKNTFQYEEGESTYISFGEIYYNGSLKEWFEIDFEEYIVCNKNQTRFSLYTTYYLVGEKAIYSILEIPEGVETIKSYSCANFGYIEVTIPSSVHTIEEHAFINEVVDIFIGLENVENVHEDAFK